MKYELIKSMNPSYSAIEQVLTNRGIPYNEIQHYTHTTDADINDYMLLGEQALSEAATLIVNCIMFGGQIAVIVDADDDGYTSAAILINYLHHLFPDWIENNLIWYMHKGKQHGLDDCIDWILDNGIALVIVPDGASNDFEQHKILKEHHIPVVIFDHHDIDHLSPDATVINIQMSEYPNKELSGAGVVWQFCRYLDNLLNDNYADLLLDLVALGLNRLG